MSEETHIALANDRMRTMLLRAAEIRESEQQQMFDSLDEIHARLGALDALGTVRKRLTELPDRTEIGVLAERMDEALAKLEAQDTSLDALATVRRRVGELPDRAELSGLAERMDAMAAKLDAQDIALAALARGFDAIIDKITDKLAVPLAALNSRLDGVIGRFEGVAGRLDGLEDRLSGLHVRLSELDSRLDRYDIRLEGLPSAVAAAVRERMDGLDAGLRSRLDEIDHGVHQHLDGTREGLRGVLLDALAEVRAAVYGRLDALAEQSATLTSRLDQVGDMLLKLVRQANEESERRNAGQLDEAMAAIAEMVIGRGFSATHAARPPLQHRGRGKLVATVKDGEQPVAAESPPPRTNAKNAELPPRTDIKPNVKT